MKNKKIYLLLTDTGTIFTKLIKAYTKKPYNHASIALDSDISKVYSFGRKNIRNPFNGGFVREDMNSILFQQANCAIYSLNVTDNQLKMMSHHIKEMAVQKENYRYNFLGLFGVILNQPITGKNAFFCSQFVATILKENNIVSKIGKDPSLIKPSELPNLADFQLIFEGKLTDYQNRTKQNGVQVPT